MTSLVRRSLFREKTTFFKKRSNAVESIDDTKSEKNGRNEANESNGKKKNNLKTSKSEDFTRFQQQDNNGEVPENRLKGIKNNISSLNEKLSGAFKGDSNSSTESSMNNSKPPKMPGRGLLQK